MTAHEIKDVRRSPQGFSPDTAFSLITRDFYKKVIRIQDRSGQPFRVETIYRNGAPVKRLTLLERV